MAILIDESARVLKKRILESVAKDLRALPDSAKVFSAVVKLIGFARCPTIKTTSELNKLVSRGYLEIHRGVASDQGIPAQIFGKAFIAGEFYPGSHIALGHGAYFAEPKIPVKGQKQANFSHLRSETALKYARGGGNGIILRCLIPPEAKIIDREDVKELYAQYRTRAKRVGINDLGTFCAAMGYDGIKALDMHNWTDEVCYNILNRSVLVTQRVFFVPEPEK